MLPILTLVNASADPAADENLQLIAKAINAQIARHACPAWQGQLWHCIASNEPAIGTYPLFLFDTPDVANALGYHDETPDGQLYGRIFRDPIFDNGGTWTDGPLSVSVTFSHEALEVFGDPFCNQWAADGKGRLIARELCDPCEHDAYEIYVHQKKVFVSNFVFPEWFDWHAPQGARFDQMKTLSAPFSMSAGGYLIYETDANDAQQQFNANDTIPQWKTDLKKASGGRSLRRGALS